MVSSAARKSGATLACTEDAERMLAGGELVGVWPEGFKGIGKPYSERYKLQRFGRGGFVSAAMRTGVPIVPLSVVGAEEIYPLVGNVPSLARLLGVPYIPITPFFPLLGPLGLLPLPSKWLLEFGEPIRTDEYDAGAADDPMLVFNVTDQVRETIQQTLYSLLMKRQSVFRLRSRAEARSALEPAAEQRVGEVLDRVAEVGQLREAAALAVAALRGGLGAAADEALGEVLQRVGGLTASRCRAGTVTGPGCRPSCRTAVCRRHCPAGGRCCWWSGRARRPSWCRSGRTCRQGRTRPQANR